MRKFERTPVSRTNQRYFHSKIKGQHNKIKKQKKYEDSEVHCLAAVFLGVLFARWDFSIIIPKSKNQLFKWTHYCIFFSNTSQQNLACTPAELNCVSRSHLYYLAVLGNVDVVLIFYAGLASINWCHTMNIHIFHRGMKCVFPIFQWQFRYCLK